MAEFSLSFTMGNAAFADQPGAEVARILREIASKVEGGSGFEVGENIATPIRDANGNRIGDYCADLVDLDDE